MSIKEHLSLNSYATGTDTNAVALVGKAFGNPETASALFHRAVGALTKQMESFECVPIGLAAWHAFQLTESLQKIKTKNSELEQLKRDHLDTSPEFRRKYESLQKAKSQLYHQAMAVGLQTLKAGGLLIPHPLLKRE